jgi:soluble lytic murein transglycosylase
MRYLKAAGIGVLVFLFLNGIQAVALNSETKIESDDRVVFVGTANETIGLQNEVERLRALSSIREVLELNFSEATLEEKRNLAETIYEACTLFEIDVELVLAVIQTESSFDTRALSHKGAMGLMQVMPRTGWAMSEEMQLEGFDSEQLFDYRTNIMLGTYYLKKLLNRYNNLEHALLAYNAGPTLLDSVMARNKTLPIDYASKVRRNMKRIAKLHFVSADSNE